MLKPRKGVMAMKHVAIMCSRFLRGACQHAERGQRRSAQCMHPLQKRREKTGEEMQSQR